MNKLVLTLAAIAFAAPAFAQDETSAKMDQVPQAARDAAKANANGVTFKTVQIDDDEGTKTYEFSGAMPNGMMLEVDVLADGTVEEVERQIAMEAVPEAVVSTLNQELAGFKPDVIEESTRDDGKTVIYEFEGKHEGEEIDVEINADGTGFTRNEDMAG